MVIVVVNGITHSVIDMRGFRIFFFFGEDGFRGWLDKI